MFNSALRSCGSRQLDSNSQDEKKGKQMNHDIVSYDWADRLVHAHDASVYRLVPRAVARPRRIDDVQRLLTQARTERIGMTFRAGGTSLSGQAVTQGLLVVLGRGWDSFTIGTMGETLTCGPALRGSVANAALAKFNRRIGPDPASIQAACLGGIVANNASGMCCGVEENSYQTLQGLKVLLASGTVLDTREVDCEQKFRTLEPELYRGLLNLRDRVRSSPRLVELIRQKTAIKNTTGYGLQAFLDYEKPTDLLTHLLVGSEGTLAFIADMTLRTVSLRPHRASALLSFENLSDACEVTPHLRELGFSAVELFDYQSIQALRGNPQLPNFLNHLGRNSACLLVQAQQDDKDELVALLDRAEIISQWHQIGHRTEFFADQLKQNQLWDLRKGIFPAVGARRPRGTSVIIEDVAFPLPRLSEGTLALRALLEKHEYQDAVIYGHARDGNLHFILSQNFSSTSEIRRYERFIDDMVDCVAGRFGGSLKAEHGTGRNMAPFVEKEWGTEAFLLMRELKVLFDPENIFNPDVLINSNPRAHLENLKDTPLVDEHLDACIECGFCEPVCPSQGLTLSPRGRIVLQRELANPQTAGALDSEQVDYLQTKTCAADGLCAKACPVGINTGTWVKKQRCEQSGSAGRLMARFAAQDTTFIESATKIGLAAASGASKIVGSRLLNTSTRALNSAFGFPVWSQTLNSKGLVSEGASSALSSSSDVSLANGSSLPHAKQPSQRVLVFRSCLTRTFDNTSNDPVIICARRAGIELIQPREAGLCCGQPWSSKGYSSDAAYKLEQFIETFFKLSDGGSIPIVIDNSPCALAVLEDSAGVSDSAREKLAKLKILDPTDFALHLAQRLKIEPLKEATRFFPVCSVVKSGRSARFEELARLISETPVFPLQTACCGMAGDRGLWFPELTENARQRFHWSSKEKARGFCTSRTCEVALSDDETTFDSIYVALELASRATRCPE